MTAEGPPDAPTRPEARSRPIRWATIARFALRRLLWRTRRTEARQTLATVGVVALAVTLLLVVTGVSIALADDPGIESADADYLVLPEDGASLSTVVDVDGPRLGNVHDRTADLEAREDVTSATPVLVDVIRVQTPDSDGPIFALAVGVVPDEEAPTVAGMEPGALEGGDPHYAEGSYDGEYTGDLLLSEAAAEQLNASAGDPVSFRSGTTGSTGDDEHVVRAIDTPSGQTVGDGLPIVVFRLSELQAVSGADDGDLADQVLVRADGDVSSDLESVFPEATVVEAGGSDLETLRSDDLALALSGSAAIVGIGLSVLFVATTTGLAVDGDRRTIAVLAALGFSRGARLGIVGVTVLALTVAGALCGVVVGALGVALVNAIAQATVTSEPVVSLGSWAVPYALGVAVVSALLAAPYPLLLAARTSVLEELGR
ncbi:ABC transporter permease [Natrononativus amylolyticus]|uniref:ABC transporter permease n=1 Tax=Natrononativus amylolyticus TaxID=2963434 RepID=UPI0020CD3EFF|nr:ABC transporter permease [Natrononativus amylolyticus]